MAKKVKKVAKAKEVEVTKGPPISKEELAQMLNEQMRKQIQACRKELDEANKKILDKYQCDLEISVTVTPRGNFPTLTVIPRPPQQ